MPKRPATPPPADDSQFFTIVNPYPEQPFLTLEDSKTFARWIACIVGQENLLAFYHKPKSPNVVIVELTKDAFGVRRLLGEHRWCEILKAPSKEDAREVSCVFPCTLTTPWSLEKVRWLRCDVESSWFRNWVPEEDSCIVCPYPKSHYCKPPVEDVTRTPLCRPLRAHLFRETTENLSNPVLAPIPRPAAAIPGAAVAAAISRHDALTPSSESSDSDDLLPTPPGLTPPGLVPITQSGTLPFVPAIHGGDAPKTNNLIVIDPGQDHQVRSLWPNYGEADDAVVDDLCEVHGVMCSSGICKECGSRKRAVLREERMKQRQEDKDTWNRSRGRGRGNREDRNGAWGERGTAQSSPASSRAPSSASSACSATENATNARSRLRADIPANTVKGKAVRGASYTKTAPSTTRALPAHLRKGASNDTTPAICSPTGSVPTRIPSAASASASSVDYDDDDERSDSATSSIASAAPSARESSILPAPAPWTKPKHWQAYAKVQSRDDDDEQSSVASGTTRDAFRNPWKRVPTMQAAAPRWADLVGMQEGAVRDVRPSGGERDEDEMSLVSDFDMEPF